MNITPAAVESNALSQAEVAAALDSAFASLWPKAWAYQRALGLVRLGRDLGLSAKATSDLEADLAEQRGRFLRAHAEYVCVLERAQALVERQPAKEGTDRGGQAPVEAFPRIPNTEGRPPGPPANDTTNEGR